MATPPHRIAGVGALLIVLGTLAPARASDPPSHNVTAPSEAGRRTTIQWSGVILPGSNPTSSCTNAVLPDRHTIHLTVPPGLYKTFAIRAAFTITWDGPVDGIITVKTPSGSALNGDNGFVSTPESVKLVNPAPGAYEVLACAFAGATPQTYTGSLELVPALLGVCRSDRLAGIDLQTATILDFQRAFDDGSLTSRRLVQEYLDRIAVYDRAGPALDAVRELNPRSLAEADALDAERARGKVRGPLHGIPVMLKDNVGTTDMPTTAGSIALEGSIPKHDAFLTQQLRDAGAIILGKLNLSEFANWVGLGMPSGYSSLGGQVLNPYHFGDPSGSSSGSGVAAAMALATATIGTETSGSILSPSIANSAVGIKPTVGLVSRFGVIPLSGTFDTPGPITRSVTDAAIVLGAIAGVDARDPATAGSAGKLPGGSNYRPFIRADGLSGARIGVSDDDRASLGEQQLALFDTALADMEAKGATIVHIDSLADEPVGIFSNARSAGLVELAVIPNEFKHDLNEYLANETSPNLRVRTLHDIIEYNKKHTDKVRYGQFWLETSDATLGNKDEPSAVASRTATIQGARGLIDATFLANDIDAIVAPGAINANIGAAALYPSIAVPAGYTEKGTQPFGITFLGSAFSEQSLIKYAFAYEAASHLRMPPTRSNRGLCQERPATTRVKGVHRSRPVATSPSLPATGIDTGVVPGVVLMTLAAALAGGTRRHSRRHRRDVS
jgi:amidase